MMIFTQIFSMSIHDHKKLIFPGELFFSCKMICFLTHQRVYSSCVHVLNANFLFYSFSYIFSFFQNSNLAKKQKTEKKDYLQIKDDKTKATRAAELRELAAQAMRVINIIGLG